MDQNNTQIIEKSRQRFLKGFKFVFIALCFAFYFNIVLPSLPSEDMAPECMTDYFHWKFDKVNNYLHENPKLVKYLITLSSLIYDLFIPIAIGIWMFLDRNRRFSIAFGLIHVLRLICIYVHLMKVPDKIIWNDPGILPSLTVSYSIPTVFFYNGQIAILALSIYYLFSLKDWKRKIAIYVYCPLLIFQMALMLCLRTNYSIDIIFGVVTAHYIFWISGRIECYMQNKFKYSQINTAKAVLLGILLLCIHIYFVKFYTEKETPKCVIDRGFRFTDPINAILNKDKNHARYFLIGLSTTIDIYTLIFATLVIFIIDTCGLLISFILGFIFRAFGLYLLIFSYPENEIWFDTEIFSFCPFDMTPDFFFSGHLFLMTLAAIAGFNFGGKIRKLSCYLLWPITFTEFWLLMIVRVHYSIDLIFGVFMGHYFMMIVSLFASKVDAFFYRQATNLAIVCTGNRKIKSQ